MTNNLFKRIIASYLLVCIIPIFTGMFAYKMAEKNSEAKASQIAVMMLERASTAMDGVFSQVESAAIALSVDDDVNGLISSDSIDKNINTHYKLFEARAALERNKLANDNLTDLMLYCEKPGVMITSSHIFIGLDRFYNKFFKYSNMTLPQFKAEILDSYSAKEYYPARDIMVRIGSEIGNVQYSNAILYSRKISYGTGRGRIMALVSLDALSSSLEDILRDYNGCVIIRNEANEELATLGKVSEEVRTQAIDTTTQDGVKYVKLDTEKGEMLVSMITSESGWHYMSVLSSDKVYGDLKYIKYIVWAVVVLETLLLLFLALMFTRRSVKPVEGIMEMLGGDEDVSQPAKMNEYDYIQKMITLMKKNYDSMSQKLDSHSIILRNRLVSERLRETGEDKALRESFERAQIRYPEDDVAFILLRIDDGESDGEHVRADLARIVLCEWLDKLPSNKFSYAKLDIDRIGIIIYEGNERAGLERFINSMNTALDDAGCMQPIVVVCPNDGRNSLNERYTRACTRLHRWDALSGSVDWISADTELRSIGVHYSVKLEEQLIRSIKAGAVDEVKQALDKIVSSNSALMNECCETRLLLANAFRLTCARAQREAQFTASEGERDYVNVNPNVAIRDSEPFEDFSSWCMHATRQLESQRKIVNVRFADSVCQYLQENYSDNQLSLCSVAQKFEYSETYFSRMFKAQKGVTYSEYLEKLRIEHACELLREGESIDATAEKVGYNSVTVFRAAFKRICGTTPSDYKGKEII